MRSQRGLRNTSKSTADKLSRAARLIPLPSLLLFLCLSEAPATLLAVCSALLLHEAGHLFFFLASGMGMPRLSSEAVGLRLSPDREMTGCSALLVLSGGALANLLGGVIFYRLGWTTVGATHLSAAVFNLLPIGSSDGGQLFSLLCRRILPVRSARLLSDGVTLLLLGFIFFFGLLSFYFSGYGLSAVYFSVFFFFSCFRGAFHDF